MCPTARVVGIVGLEEDSSEFLVAISRVRPFDIGVGYARIPRMSLLTLALERGGLRLIQAMNANVPLLLEQTS